MKKTVKVTIGQIIDYVKVGDQWLKSNPNNQNTKLGYAMMRSRESIDKALKPYTDLDNKIKREVEDIRIKYAATDGSGIVIMKQNPQGGESFEYKKEELIKLNKEVRDLEDKYNVKFEELRATEVELEAYFALEIPQSQLLNDYYYEAMKGIVIDPEHSRTAPLVSLTK